MNIKNVGDKSIKNVGSYIFNVGQSIRNVGKVGLEPAPAVGLAPCKIGINKNKSRKTKSQKNQRAALRSCWARGLRAGCGRPYGPSTSRPQEHAVNPRACERLARGKFVPALVLTVGWLRWVAVVATIAGVIAWPAVAVAAASACRVVSSSCGDATPCKQGGSGIWACLQGQVGPDPYVNVNASCWRTDYVYDCGTGQLTDDQKCTDLKARGCYETASDCILKNGSNCTAFQKTMFCPDNTTADPIQDCTAKSYCMDGACFDTSYKNDPNNFSRAVAVMEMAREIGVYSQSGIFKGLAQGCREGYSGVRDCCSVRPSGEAASISNQVVMGLAMSGVKNAATAGWDWATAKATPYVYDYVTNTFGPGVASYIGAGKDAAAVAGSGASAGFNISFAGFGYSSGLAAATPATADAALSSAGGSGAMAIGQGSGFYFSPTGAAIFVAMQAYAYASSCTSAEQQLSLKRAANTCVAVPAASFCSQKILGSCGETTNEFCCFNSVLARIVNVSAKQQLGISMSYGEGNPNCDAITVDQLTQLDFSKIDLTDFYQSIDAAGHDASWWQGKIDTATKAQQAQVTGCAQYTDPQQKADCQKSTQYSVNGSSTTFSSQVTGSDLADDNDPALYQQRTNDRTDYSVQSGKADTQTAPGAQPGITE